MLSIPLRFALILFLSLTLSACGFHLRGKINVPTQLQVVSINSNDSNLAQQLTKNLEANGIQIVDEQGTAQINLNDVIYHRDVNGTDANGLATSYEFSYTLQFEAIDDQENKLSSHALSQQRTLAYDPTNELLFEREEDFLKEDMQEELVTQMLRRISAIQ